MSSPYWLCECANLETAQQIKDYLQIVEDTLNKNDRLTLGGIHKNENNTYHFYVIRQSEMNRERFRRLVRIYTALVATFSLSLRDQKIKLCLTQNIFVAGDVDEK